MKDISFYQQEYDSGKSLNEICKKFPEASRNILQRNLKFRTRAAAISLSNKNKPRKTSIEVKAKLSASQKLAHAEGRHPGWAHKNMDLTRSSYPEKWMRKVIKNDARLSCLNVQEQLNIGKYFLDFAISDLKFDLEIDGIQHDRPEVHAKDKIRDAYLRSLGWKVYRIKWKSCYHDTQATIEALVSAILNTENIMSTLKELVQPGKTVHFEMYRKGELHYKTSDGFSFVVPVQDCGDAEFLKEDKAMLFMRYIRKQLEANAQGQAE